MSRDRSTPAGSESEDQGLDPRHEELLAMYLDRLNLGERIDAEQILADHPEQGPALLMDLQAFIDFTPGEDSSAPLGTLGDYTLRRQIGRGGMGVVYEAWENSMDRRVALKVLPAGIAADTRASARFLREAQTAGKLSHPNVVPVYFTGVKEQTPFYAMEYVEGETLAQILARTKDAESETATPFGKKDDLAYFSNLARAFADVADGLQHAHSRGVIHRDIKPSNLILDGDGRLRILDFGLARLEGQESLTISGDLVGTPLYMSPEQARQRKIEIDHRTDIYSLGATVYEAITGRPPFQGKDHRDTLSQIIERDPVEPRKLNSRVPKDLETIVLKCLRKDASDRYGTAEALAQDLRRFVRGDPIEARPLTALERFVHKASVNWRRLLVWGVILVLVTLSVVLLSVIEMNRRAARQHEFERQQREFDHLVLIQKMKILRCQTTLEAAAGRSRVLESQGFFTFSDFERHAADVVLGEVIEALTALARLYPQRFEAHYHLARALYLSGRPEEARASLESALEREPGFPPALVLEAELAGEKLDADRLRGSGAMLRGADWKAEWLRALLARSAGRPADAARAYDRLIALDRNAKIPPGFSVDLRLERGLAYLDAGDYRGAADDFIVAADHWPEFLEPGLLLGKTYLLDSNAAWAEETFEKIHREALSPDEADEAARWIVLLHLSLGDSFQALRWARRIAEPVDQRWLSGWCLVTLFGGEDYAADEARRQQALVAARNALSVNPGDVDALLTTAFSRWWTRSDTSEKKFEDVVRLCKKVIDIDPENARAYGLLTSVSLVRGETSRTLELVRKLGGLAGRDPLVIFIQDYTLWVLGRNAELEKALEAQAKEAQPTQADTLYEKGSRLGFRAEILAREGRHRDALAMYEKALEVDPGRSWLENFKCTRLFQLGEYEDAAECFGERAARGAEVYSRMLEHVLVTLGRPGDAVFAACKALEADPQDGRAMSSLLGLVRKHGDDALPGDVASVLRRLEDASAAADANPLVLTTLAFLRLHGPGVQDPRKARDAIAQVLEMPGKPDAEALAILAEVYHAEGSIGEAVRKLEEALRRPGTTQAHRRLLDRWWDEAPDLPSYASVDAALASRQPGGEDDLDLLRNFPRDPKDAAAERRFSYLKAQVLARSGKLSEAIALLTELADIPDGHDPEPHLRLSECLVASGKAEAAEAHLRRVLTESGEVPAELWYAWLDVCRSHLHWSPSDCLERLPERDGDTLGRDIRWLLDELSAGRPIRIDCAGTEECSSSSGVLWSRDRFFRGGWAKNWSGTPWGRPTVKGSADDWLYAMSRWFEGDAYRPGYAIPLPRGRYRVTLHFCESWAGAAGVRLFDVLIEGEKKIDGYDGYARAGFGVATSVVREVAVEDGLLEIEFRARKGWWADVAAIEVIPIP